MVNDKRLADRIPPHVFFLISSIFHYLGPALAVLLFAHVAVLGVMWLRITTAAVVFAIWRKPWRIFPTLTVRQRWLLAALGVALGLMNSTFYEAIARLPLSTVGAIEFIGPIVLAAAGARTPRNLAAFALAISGGWLLTHARFEGATLGYLYAFANCALFVIYIVLGHRIAGDGATAGIDRLGAAMLIAAVTALPIGIRDALPALTHPALLLAGIGVGLCSSVIPYVCDQLAMARLPRSSFALLLSLLPAWSTLIGLLVLRQVPSTRDLAGILFVAVGVGLHRVRDVTPAPTATDRLRAAALESRGAWEVLTHLADDIGPRPCGSPNAALAVAWTTERFRSWGIDVRNEPVTVPRWVRGAESASLPSHNDQRLTLTAMGGSVAASVTAGVVESRSFDDLGPHVAGKVVYFHNPIDMDRVRDRRALEAYRDAVVFRSAGASRAAAHGAAGVLLHSVGSASLRTPHTGNVVYAPELPRIPAAALTAEDALLVHRLLARGDDVQVRLALESATQPDVESANVVAEIPGRSREIVLLGAHLDSWDLGTGAVDNGSGVAMIMETMRLIRESMTDAGLAPERTIRCVLFMNEELSGTGSHAYDAAHGHEPHAAAIECDSGAAAPLGFVTTVRDDALTVLRRRVASFTLLERAEHTGVDTARLVARGVPGFGLNADPLHYFDVHHSAADTLDKVDPVELARCTAAVTALTWTLASA